MAARHALAAGMGKALRDKHGPGPVVLSADPSDVADTIVEYLERPKTLLVLLRFCLERLLTSEGVLHG